MPAPCRGRLLLLAGSGRRGLGCVPVDFLDVLGLRGEMDAAARTARFEHFAAPGGGHAGAETVHPLAASNFWLIRAFRHDLITLKKISHNRAIIPQGGWIGQRFLLSRFDSLFDQAPRDGL